MIASKNIQALQSLLCFLLSPHSISTCYHLNVYRIISLFAFRFARYWNETNWPAAPWAVYLTINEEETSAEIHARIAPHHIIWMALLLPSGHSSPNLQVQLILKCFAYLETREFVIASNEQCTAFPHYSPVQTLAWCELQGPAAGNGSSWVSLSTSTGFLLVPPSPSSFSGERGPAPWPH